MPHLESVQGNKGSCLDGLLFRLRDMEVVKKSGHLKEDQQYSGAHVLFASISGEGRLKLGNQEIRLKRDVACLCPPGETFGWKAGKGLKLFLFWFDVFRETGEKSLLSFKKDIVVYPADKLADLCEKSAQLWHSPDGLERFRCQVVFQEMLYYVLSSIRSQPVGTGPVLEAAKEYMERHFQENVTVDQLAMIAKVSPKYFVDLFKKTYGISAINYLTELRIYRAKQLIVGSDLRLKDIAHQVGYHDEFYFSRKFKKEVGVSPTAYMKRRLRKIAAYHPAVIGQLLPLQIIPYAAPLHPKWTAYYSHTYGPDIPVHLSAYRQNQDWKSNLQKLDQSRPELVISREGIDHREKKRLEEISPVIYLPARENWRRQLLFLAENLNELREAEQWLQSYERKVAWARDGLKQRVGDDTFLILRVSQQKIFAYCNRSIHEVFYGDLQLVPACHMNRPVYDEPVSLEKLAHFDADRLLLILRRERETLSYWEKLKVSMEWQELKAVRKNRIHFIPSDPCLEYSAGAHDRMIDELFELLCENHPN